MIDVLVKPDDAEPYKMTIDSRDVVMWERLSEGKKTINDFAENQSFVDLYKLAHIAAKRQGKFDGSVEDFEEKNALEQLDEDDYLPNALENLLGRKPTEVEIKEFKANLSPETNTTEDPTLRAV